jgi:hypothetical protein
MVILCEPSVRQELSQFDERSAVSLAYGGVADFENLRDLRMAQPLDIAHQEDFPIAFGELVHGFRDEATKLPGCKALIGRRSAIDEGRCQQNRSQTAWGDG